AHSPAIPGRVHEPRELFGREGPALPARFGVRVNPRLMSKRVATRPAILYKPPAEGFHVTQVVIARLNAEQAGPPAPGEPPHHPRWRHVAHEPKPTTFENGLDTVTGLPRVLLRVATRFEVAAEVHKMFRKRPALVRLAGIRQPN